MGHLDFLHGGDIYQAERKHKKEIIDFSANINPLGLSSQVKKTILNNLDRIQHYPDPKAWAITQKIAQHWGIGCENILIGNGSVEFIYLITFTYRPKLILIPVPTFSEYERAGRAAGSQLRFLELDEEKGFKLDLADIGGIDLLFLCNPNNPTGNLILKNKKIDTCPGKLLVIDEAFMDFLPDEESHTLIRRAQIDKKIIVLRTFTKFYALPGLRLGYLVAHKENVQRLKQHQIPWSVNSLAQMVGEHLLNDRKYHRSTLQLIESEGFYLFNQIRKIEGLKPYPTAANFLLIKIKKPKLTSNFLTKELLDKGILIRDCSNFRNLNNKFIRIAVCSRKENEKLISTLNDVL